MGDRCRESSLWVLAQSSDHMYITYSLSRFKFNVQHVDKMLIESGAGGMYSWGNGAAGQLGLGSKTNYG
jgi:hypothetical protein